MEKSIQQVVAEKAAHLNSILANKFSSKNPLAASGGEDEKTAGGIDMKVTRSSNSGAPGEVVDGKLVDVKALAATAAHDTPATDLMALARANDPHNENSIPVTIAGAVTAATEGLPSYPAETTPDLGLGNVEKEQKDSLHSKQHPAVEKAVDTKVENQLSSTDQYKSLHAASDIDAIVARAKALVEGGQQIMALAETPKSQGAGKVEKSKDEPVPAASDAAKNAPDSAKTMSAAKSPADVMKMIRQRVAEKVEGHPLDPVPSSSDAGKTPESTGTDFPQKAAPKTAAPAPRVAEVKDRPLASMPEGKPRYKADDDNRDEEAASYWKKNQADEKRFSQEPESDRPITREMQEKMPKLSPKANLRRQLLTRVAGLSMVLAADEAERLHLKRTQYKRDIPKDMDYPGAAKETERAINKEHGERAKDTHLFSPMMSRLWSARGPVKTAASDTGYKGKLESPEGRTEMKKQLEQLRSALKGLKAEDQGADGQMQAMQTKIEGLESEMSKASGVHIGLNGIDAVASAVQSLGLVAQTLRDINVVCAASHMELGFSEEKPEGAVDKTKMLVQDIGETAEMMEEAIHDLMKEMGIPLPSKEKEEPEHKGPSEADNAGALPGMGGKDEAPAPRDEKEIGGLGDLGAAWTARFTKVADAANAEKADMVSSYWEVMRDGQPVLKASVGQLYPVKSAEDKAKAFAWCATKDYGRKLLAAVRADGLTQTAKVLGLTPLIKSAAAGPKKMDEKGYYSKAYGSPEYASELLKDHEKKAAAQRAGLEAKIAALETEKKAQTDRNDRLQKDIQLRAKAERALELANRAIAKGLFPIEQRASFIDKLMVGDDNSYKLATSMVESFVPPAATRPEEKKAEVSPREMLRAAAAGGGLKTAIVLESKPPVALGTSSLEQMWRKPPTAQ